MKITKTPFFRCGLYPKRIGLARCLTAGGFIILMLVSLSACKAKKPDEQRRYVVLSPEVAEIMAALDLGQDIVGLTDECTYPPEFKSIPKIGKFGMVRKETVLKLEPQIVFTSGLEQDAITTELKKLKLEVVSVYPRSLEDMYAAIISIGDVTGRQERARTLVSELQASIKTTTDKSTRMIKPKVYIEINRDPLMSVSDQSFVGQLIETAGGDNIFPALERDYARVSAEDVIKAAPDIIICYSQDSLSNLIARKGWQEIPAIKNGLIYTEQNLDPDLIQRAGPRARLGIKRLNDLFLAWGNDQRP